MCKMAPRKNDENTAKSTRKGVTKVKAEKPKQKKPVVIKIKLPVNSPRNNNVISKPKKKTNKEDMMELANEVALAQLSKTPKIECPQPEGPPTRKSKKKLPTQHKTVASKRKKTDSVKSAGSSESAMPSRQDVTVKKETPDLPPIQEPVKKIGKKTGPSKIKNKKKPAAPKQNGQVITTEQVPKKIPATRGRPKLNRPTKIASDVPKIQEPCKEVISSIQPKSNQQKPSGIERSSRTKEPQKRFQITNTGPKTSVCKKVNSRNSSNSSDRYSWTRDITYTNSTTTCYSVQPNDFVRIDNKLPIIEVAQIPPNKAFEAIIESSSLSSSSLSSSSSSSSSDYKDDISAKELNLSVSTTITSQSNNRLKGEMQQGNTDLENKPLDINTLQNLLNEIGKQNNELVQFLGEQFGNFKLLSEDQTSEAVCDVLGIEIDALSALRQLNKNSSEDIFARPKTPAPRPSPVIPVPRPAPVTPAPRPCPLTPTLPPAPAPPGASPAPAARHSPVPESQEEVTKPVTIRMPSIDQENYDDDAISIYAESFGTAIESRTSMAPEEYIPTPVVSSPPTRTYQPTRIEPATRRPTVCEVHTADSTSVRDAKISNETNSNLLNLVTNTHQIGQIFSNQPATQEPVSAYSNFDRNEEDMDLPLSNYRREPHDYDDNFATNIVSDSQENFTPFSKLDTKSEVIEARDTPAWASAKRASEPAAAPSAELAGMSVHEVDPLSPGSDPLFRGMCFNYTAGNQCRFQPCRFRHMTPANWPTHFKRHMSPISDVLVLREMKMVWKFEMLCMLLAPLFVAELARRGLTRAMMEALEVAAREPASVAALEAALLHLNQVDLTQIADHLTRPMCDAMLRALTTTQNFSRFRAVFCNLADYITAKDQKVSLYIASKILDRVSILPCTAMARAALNIVKQTSDTIIYELNTMEMFETYLKRVGGSLLEDFEAYKASRRRLRAAPPVRKQEPQERYTSPDTTHLDNMNNIPLASMITRTIELQRGQADTMLVPFKPPAQPPSLFMAPPPALHPWRPPHRHRQYMRPQEPGGWSPMHRPNKKRRTVNTRPLPVSYEHNNFWQDNF